MFRKTGIDLASRPIPDLLTRAGSFQNRWVGLVDLAREHPLSGIILRRAGCGLAVSNTDPIQHVF
jgi:hypothetical protein